MRFLGGVFYHTPTVERFRRGVFLAACLRCAICAASSTHCAVPLPRAELGVSEVDTGELIREIWETIDWPDSMKLIVNPLMPTMMTERGSLQRVFHNLMTNAVKYCRVAEPQLEISSRDMGDRYEFCVRDNGPGIVPEYHDRVFQMFKRLHGHEEIEGNGMGLGVSSDLGTTAPATPRRFKNQSGVVMSTVETG